MDFFTAANDTAALSLTANDKFAQAITANFSTFTACLPAVLPPPTLSRKTTAIPAPPASTKSGSDFEAIHSIDLPSLLQAPSVLFIDIRPHAAFTNARLPNALSLSVPSTLLKRPLFSLEKLAAMLSSTTSRSRFLKWNQSMQIIVYDADSSSLPDTSNILGLLKKFANERPAYTGKLCWLQGGFQGVWRDHKELIDQAPISSPPSAFRAPRRSSPAPGSLRPSMSISHQQPYNPFFETVRQNVELSHGITERIPLKLPPRVKQRISELPFQWLRDIASRSASAQEQDVEESMEALAMQFYRIELAEQRRLMGVMEHHSRESQPASASSTSTKPFPFSITAGVEKGAKNRYRHIWPFEHARVRLHNSQPLTTLTIPPPVPLSEPTPAFATSLPLRSSNDEDDYVNASYVQPLCTRRRYIATQGPLDATFNDFWTLVWQQNVHVIVMLTREIEGSTVKCGHYWQEGTYGSLRLQLVSCEGQEDPGDTLSTTGGFFNDANSATKSRSMVKRTFILTHRDLPHSTPREIVHFQYLDWPDMNVPDDPRGILGLIKEVGRVWTRLSPADLEINPRVGRTGGFIAVDAVLDGLRTEIRKSHQSMSRSSSSSSLDRDLDGDVVMGDGEGCQFLPPMSDPPSMLRQTTTRQWAELVDGATTESDGPSSLDNDSLFGFPSKRTARKDTTDSELSPYGVGSGYTTASSLAPSSLDGPAPSDESTKTRDFNLSLLARVLVVSKVSPESRDDSFPPPPSSRSISPFARDSTHEQSSPPSCAAPPPLHQILTNSAPDDESDVRNRAGYARAADELCQSLRQYVFVHAAVIEGALMVLDEEREKAGVEKVTFPDRSRRALRLVDSSISVNTDSGSLSSSSHGKRGASPTELLKEDSKGGLLTSKRPSIKRKQRSNEGELHAYPPRRGSPPRPSSPAPDYFANGLQTSFEIG
ncbi:hypothetical protein CPB85DRAFT_1565533 [Mucidula mucida]|nr:hypothetical protein CPB85DRAFT_1565533 [Mucidula mucida]